jgi:hypothetical protein
MPPLLSRAFEGHGAPQLPLRQLCRIALILPLRRCASAAPRTPPTSLSATPSAHCQPARDRHRHVPQAPRPPSGQRSRVKTGGRRIASCAPRCWRAGPGLGWRVPRASLAPAAASPCPARPYRHRTAEARTQKHSTQAVWAIRPEVETSVGDVFSWSVSERESPRFAVRPDPGPPHGSPPTAKPAASASCAASAGPAAASLIARDGDDLCG